MSMTRIKRIGTEIENLTDRWHALGDASPVMIPTSEGEVRWSMLKVRRLLDLCTAVLLLVQEYPDLQENEGLFSLDALTRTLDQVERVIFTMEYGDVEEREEEEKG